MERDAPATVSRFLAQSFHQLPESSITAFARAPSPDGIEVHLFPVPTAYQNRLIEIPLDFQ